MLVTKLRTRVEIWIGIQVVAAAPEFCPLPAHELADQSPFRAWIRRSDTGHQPIFLEPPLYPPRNRKNKVIML